ncbi:hypothetical protein ABZP36_010226 [Zizania latifolia]
MASAVVPDIWQWIRSLPKQWRRESCSLQFCNSSSTNQSLNLIITCHSEAQSFDLSWSICAEFHDPISLWSSHYSRLESANGSDIAANLLQDIISGVLRYGPYSSKKSLLRLPNVQVSEDSGEIFNLAALTLALMVCIYESPSTLRRELIGKIGAQLMRSDMRGAAKKLLLAMGSNSSLFLIWAPTLKGIGLTEKKLKNNIRWKGIDDSRPGEVSDDTAILQDDIEALSLKEHRLDEQISETRENLRELTKDENNQKWLYVTEDDMKSLPCFQLDLIKVIASQRPGIAATSIIQRINAIFGDASQATKSSQDLDAMEGAHLGLEAVDPLNNFRQARLQVCSSFIRISRAAGKALLPHMKACNGRLAI